MYSRDYMTGGDPRSLSLSRLDPHAGSSLIYRTRAYPPRISDHPRPCQSVPADKGYGQFSLIQPAQRLRLRRPLLGGDRHFFSAISMTSSSFSRPSTASTAVPSSVLLVNRGRPPPGDRPKPRSSRSIDEPSTRFLSRCSQTPCFFLDSTEFDGVLVIQRVCKTTPSSSKDLPE